MNKLEKSLVVVAAMTMLGASAWLAAQEAVGDVKVAQDLTAVIALQGHPCGQVVSVATQAENDYLATCQNGNRYRVFVNPAGRVIVEKLG